MQQLKVDIAIIGAGTAGLYALSEAKRLGLNWVLIEGGAGGTTCARVGCMPSKILLQAAQVVHQNGQLQQLGYSDASVGNFDSKAFMSHLRSQRDRFVNGVLSHSLDRMQEPQLLRGYARFSGPNELIVDDRYQIQANSIIVATGSSPILPADWRPFSDAIVTTDQFFEMDSLPESLAVIGLGAIGLELGQGLSNLGVRVAGYDAAKALPVVQDSLLEQQIRAAFSQSFSINLAANVELNPADRGVAVTANGSTEVFEKVLIAIGRKPNLAQLNLAAAGVQVNAHGMPTLEKLTQRIAGTNIYLAGDVSGERPVMHEAALEALMAVSSCRTPNTKARKCPLGIVFTEPNIARVGTPVSEIDPERLISVRQPLESNGRARVKHQTTGSILLYADKQSGKLLGAELFCASGEHLAHTLAWMIELNADITTLARMPVYHPVIEEALMAAIEGLAQKYLGGVSLAALKL